MKFMTLTKENASSLDIKCGKSQIYYKYEMVFFKRPIMYAFQDSVKLKRCAYSMLILGISLNDQSTINELFSKINELIEINDSSFINSKEDNNVIDISNKYMITVEIVGYKKLENDVGPIWKLKSIQKMD